MNNSILNTNYQIGLIFGKFYPLHCGHIYLIEKAATQVAELHVMLGCEEARDLKLFENSQLPKQPLVTDRLFWLKQTFAKRPNIHIHIIDEQGIASYPNGWKDWSDRVKQILLDYGVVPTVVFTSEAQDVENHAYHYQCPVKMIDADRDFINISATQIRLNPYKNWQYLAKAAKPFFVKKVAIIGNIDKFQLLPKQLANIFNTTFVTNGYVNYILHDSCQHQQQLTESDYINIAMIHRDRIEQAAQQAERVLFTALDFNTLHRLYNDRFQQTNATLQELEQKYAFDLVIWEPAFLHLTPLQLFDSVAMLVDELIQ